jgi:hypothetical protein
MGKKLTEADFEERYIPEPMSGCWLWTGPVNLQGYGCFGGRQAAHVHSYERTKGPVPEGLELDHLCRVPCCINPDHLEAVTRKENLHRSPIWNGNKTHCSKGHEYTTENTYYITAKNGRNCRECARLNAMRYRKGR